VYFFLEMLEFFKGKDYNLENNNNKCLIKLWVIKNVNNIKNN